MLAGTRAKTTMKIDLKNNLYPHMHFIEHLVVTFGKSPQESDLNNESSRLLIRRLKSYTGFSLQPFTTRTLQKN
jgi:hypothetical protein